jgi:hypothetical protein
MLFRLHNGSLLSLNDELTELSEFFMAIKQDVTPISLLADMLKKTKYKKVKAILIKIIEDILSNNCTDEDLKQLSSPESKLSLEIKARCKNQPDVELLESALAYIHTNIDVIFEPLIHHIKFVKDEMMMLVVEYLQILPRSSKKRGDNMFEGLAFLIQGSPPGTDLKSLLDPELHPYIDFIQKVNDEPLLELTKTSCLLGIKSLTYLVGCKLATTISELSEKTVRQKYNIPSKFRDSIMEKVRSLVKQEPWVNTSSDNSELLKKIGTNWNSTDLKDDEMNND